jgi:hypothetical protein
VEGIVDSLLVEVLREEGIDARYALWDATDWHMDTPSCLEQRSTVEQKRKD